MNMTKVETAFYYSTRAQCLLQVHSLSEACASVRRWEQFRFDIHGDHDIPWSYAALSCFMRVAIQESRSTMWAPKLHSHDTLAVLCELIDGEYEKVIQDRNGSFLSVIDPRVCTFTRICNNSAVALVENLRPNSAGLCTDRWVCVHHQAVAEKSLGSDLNVVFEIKDLGKRA